VATVLGSLALVQVPYGHALGFVPLGAGTLGLLAAITLGYVGASELAKRWRVTRTHTIG
jgi:hypothetical protein